MTSRIQNRPKNCESEEIYTFPILLAFGATFRARESCKWLLILWFSIDAWAQLNLLCTIFFDSSNSSVMRVQQRPMFSLGRVWKWPMCIPSKRAIAFWIFVIVAQMALIKQHCIDFFCIDPNGRIVHFHQTINCIFMWIAKFTRGYGRMGITASGQWKSMNHIMESEFEPFVLFSCSRIG